MPLGNILSGSEQQYVAHKDDKTATWRILDTWHEDLKKLQDAEEEIPDDSEAVKVLSEGQFIALIKEAARLGVLANVNFGAEESDLEPEIIKKDEEINALQEQISKLKQENSQVSESASRTDEYALKEKAMSSILKLVSMQDMSNLGKD